MGEHIKKTIKLQSLRVNNNVDSLVDDSKVIYVCILCRVSHGTG